MFSPAWDYSRAGKRGPLAYTTCTAQVGARTGKDSVYKMIRGFEMPSKQERMQTYSELGVGLKELIDLESLAHLLAHKGFPAALGLEE